MANQTLNKAFLSWQKYT